MQGIVVGHDGSPQAHQALILAADMARALGEKLTVVRSFGLRRSVWPDDIPFGYVPTTDDLEKFAKESLESEISGLKESHPDLEVEARAVEGRPAKVLLDASVGARMLVVGSRGLGGFDRLLLGSVAEQLVQHAQCPVLVDRD